MCFNLLNCKLEQKNQLSAQLTRITSKKKNDPPPHLSYCRQTDVLFLISREIYDIYVQSIQFDFGEHISRLQLTLTRFH